MDLAPVLKDHVDEARLDTLQAECLQVFGTEIDIQGVFGTGAPLGEAKVLDIRMKPSLAAVRANQKVKQHLNPELKCANQGVMIWIPVSMAEAKRKRSRKSSNCSKRKRKRQAAIAEPKSKASSKEANRRSCPRRDERRR